MMAAPIPADEQRRLHALRALGILDSPREERFDRLTRLTRKLFGVQTVLVSLVDERRQWFKSSQGLDPELRELPRDISFCGHAIVSDALLLVEDASADPRFADNPLVAGPLHVRFYAGLPLHAPGGERVGTLCLIDSRPRSLDEEERGLLADLAVLVEDRLAIETMALLDELTGLCNRRGFELMREQSLAQAQRQGRGGTLLFIDLDDFKRVNDRFGHDAGDRLLVDFAQLLRSNFRAADLVGRRGGDEFAVWMSGVLGEAEPARALQRLAEAVRQYNASQSQGWTLGYSVGMAEAAPTYARGAGALLAAADARMYAQKAVRKQG